MDQSGLPVDQSSGNGHSRNIAPYHSFRKPRGALFHHHRIAREPIDDVMDEQGLYKKRVARDALSVFRVVAEQVFECQFFHSDVRDACVRYLRRHPKKFLADFKEHHPKDTWSEYLDLLQSGDLKVCDKEPVMEIKALSLLYNRDFLVYYGENTAPTAITHNGFDDKIVMAHCGGSFYDSVLSKQDLVDGGIAQALVYEVLYKDLLAMGHTEVEVMKRLMLHHHSQLPAISEDADEEDRLEDGGSEDFQTSPLSAKISSNMEHDLAKTSDKARLITKEYHTMGSAFPFKVAKSLEAKIYRNVDFDEWIDKQKGTILRNSGRVYGPLFASGNHVLMIYNPFENKPEDVQAVTGVIQEVKENGDIDVLVPSLGRFDVSRSAVLEEVGGLVEDPVIAHKLLCDAIAKGVLNNLPKPRESQPGSWVHRGLVSAKPQDPAETKNEEESKPKVTPPKPRSDSVPRQQRPSANVVPRQPHHRDRRYNSNGGSNFPAPANPPRFHQAQQQPQQQPDAYPVQPDFHPQVMTGTSMEPFMHPTMTSGSPPVRYGPYIFVNSSLPYPEVQQTRDYMRTWQDDSMYLRAIPDPNSGGLIIPALFQGFALAFPQALPPTPSTESIQTGMPFTNLGPVYTPPEFLPPVTCAGASGTISVATPYGYVPSPDWNMGTTQNVFFPPPYSGSLPYILPPYAGGEVPDSNAQGLPWAGPPVHTESFVALQMQYPPSGNQPQ